MIVKTANRLDLEIRPIDTLMFRDGRPFNQGDPGAAEAVSVFPPHPNTVSGMVRALLGRRGGLSVSAPVVCCEKNGVLFPAPFCILRRDETCVRLGPASTGIETDLGEKTRLPQPQLTQGEDAGGLKGIEDHWINFNGLQTVLNGGVPRKDDLILRDDLWLTEPRVGIGIDNMSDGVGKPVSNLDKRRPIDGALYAATHTRLVKDVTLRVTVESLDGNNIDIGHPAIGPAGGEHRMAEFVESGAPTLPNPPPLNAEGDVVRFTIYHAAPCILHPLPRANTFFGKVSTTRDANAACIADAVVVSACLGKALMIGGWSLRDKEPTPMRPTIPAGSVWFLEAPKSHEGDIKALHGKRIGENLGRGFGAIFIGTW
jgi:CRISPR-associated protein Cmr3